MNSIVIPDKVQKGVGLVKLSIVSTELQNNHSLLKKLTKVNIAGDREYRIIYTTIAITSSYIHHQPTKYKNISVDEDKKGRWKCKPAGMPSYNYRDLEQNNGCKLIVL